MKIDLRDRDRTYLFRIEVDPDKPPSIVHPPTAPADGAGADRSKEVFLDWDGAFDDQQHIRRCPACGCRELFVRKDFPQITGLVVVLLAVVVAVALFSNQLDIWGFLLLGSAAVIDAIIYFFVGKCLVCYRCRSEFRQTPIHEDHPGWELATGEKYRQAATEAPPKS